MVAIFVLLGLDIIHRTVIAMFGAILSIILAIALGSMLAEDGLHFVIESVDFNTIGLSWNDDNGDNPRGNGCISSSWNKAWKNQQG